MKRGRSYNKSFNHRSRGYIVLYNRHFFLSQSAITALLVSVLCCPTLSWIFVYLFAIKKKVRSLNQVLQDCTVMHGTCISGMVIIIQIFLISSYILYMDKMLYVQAMSSWKKMRWFYECLFHINVVTHLLTSDFHINLLARLNKPKCNVDHGIYKFPKKKLIPPY